MAFTVITNITVFDEMDLRTVNIWWARSKARLPYFQGSSSETFSIHALGGPVLQQHPLSTAYTADLVLPRRTIQLDCVLCGTVLCSPSHLFLSFPEGRACAVVFDCKFIETSAAVQHNVKELFEGIVRQVRLRRDSKEKNERRLAYQKRKESMPRKARRFWGKIVAKNNKNMAFKLKSKSCHDLSVL